MENGRIGIRQFTLLVVYFTLGSTILIAPSGLAQGAKQDAWLAAMVGTILGMILISLYVVLGKRYPNQTLVEYSGQILGKWLGKGVSFLFICHFLLTASLLLREIGGFLTSQIMAETPIQAIHIIFIVVVVMAVRLGLETFTRAAEVFFPWVFVLFLSVVLFLIPQMKIENIQPIFEGGLKPIFGAAVFPFLSLPFLEMVVFLMIFPYVNVPKKIGKPFILGAAFGGFLIVILSLVTILVLGPDYTARLIYPSFTLARKINIGDFIQRLEALAAGIWFLTLFFKITIFFYSSVLGITQLIRLSHYKFLLWPLAMLLVLLSIITSPNIVYFNEFISKTWMPYSMTFGLFFPILLLLVDIWKRGWKHE